MRRSLLLLGSAAAFLLMMFMGWGLGGLRDFLANSARSGLVGLVMAGTAVVAVLRIDSNPLRRGRLPVGNQSITLIALAIASLALVWFLPFADRSRILVFGDKEGLRYVGLYLCAVGLAIRAVAIAELGRHFSAYVTLQNGHRLVETGIYRVIRHPLYLSLLLAGPGFALVFKSLLVFPIAIAALIFVAIRISQEEDLLAREFGDQFRDYRKRSWALIPHVI